MNHLDALREVFSEGRYRLAALAIGAAAVPVLALTSNIFSPDGLSLNPFAEPLRIALIGAIASAMALNGAVLLRNRDMRVGEGGKAAIAGSAAAFFASACPFCQPIWLVWLGLGSATAFLAGIGMYVGAFSLSALLVSLHYSLKSTVSACEVR